MDSTTRFRFRDSTIGESYSGDGSSVSTSSSDLDDESKLESMTAKGINRLCSELLELKKASDEDFHQTVYMNYSAFIRIFEKLGGMENELTQLKQHVSIKRKLVKDLTDGICLQIWSKESSKSVIEESLDIGLSMSKLEAHSNSILETLDTLLSEHRLDDAMAVLQMDTQTLKILNLEEDSPTHILTSHNSSISERKLRLADKFASVADHERVSAPESQKALSGLCRLGDSDRAAQLLLKNRSLRLAKGICDLQSSKLVSHGTYIQELAKFVFSVISQAARSFVVLYGEKSPYASELIQWAHKETEVFVCCFHKYVKSISEINGGLTTAVEAVQCALSFCSILEIQSIVLRPFLIKLIRPCMEDVWKMHIDHFKKVIGVFSATDTWVLGKYLVPGILKGDASPMIVGHKMEYCLLTNSGRKFVTLLQDIVKEISPLVNLRMENSILTGLLDLFREYMGNLERAIPNKMNMVDGASPRIILAQTLSQQLSVLANSSALVRIVSAVAKSIFKDFKSVDSQLITDGPTESLRKELDHWVFLIQAVENQLRTFFYQQFIYTVMSPERKPKLNIETYMDDPSDCDTLYSLMPSVAFQVLFIELRKLEKIGKDVFIEEDWLVKELLSELMQKIFVWLSTNRGIWRINEDIPVVQGSHAFEQIVLDLGFMVEITRFGGYYFDDMMDASATLISHMESTLLPSGLDPYRDILADGWATDAASKAIHKLLEIEKMEVLNEDESIFTSEQVPNSEQFEYTSDSVDDTKDSSDDSVELESNIAASAPESSATKEQQIENSKITGHAGAVCDHDEVYDGLDEDSICSSDWSTQSEDMKSRPLNAVGDVSAKLDEAEKNEATDVDSLRDIFHGESDEDGNKTVAAVSRFSG